MSPVAKASLFVGVSILGLAHNRPVFVLDFSLSEFSVFVVVLFKERPNLT